MAVATINWALLLITGSLSLLDLCKYANATLIHTSNYVPFNMWQSGTLSLWLTGKSVGSVKNLRSDSALKRLCRETTTTDDRAARLCLLSSTVWLIQVFVSLSVETCLKVCSLSFLSVSPGTHKKSICKLNCSTRCLWKRRASRCVCCQWTCTRSSFFFLKSRKSNWTEVHFTLQLFGFLQTASKFLWLRPIKFHNCTMTGFICAWQLSDDHFFQGINSVLETFTAL